MLAYSSLLRLNDASRMLQIEYDPVSCLLDYILEVRAVVTSPLPSFVADMKCSNQRPLSLRPQTWMSPVFSV